MKKISKYIGCVIPTVIAFSIQLLVAIVIMFGIGIYEGIQAASQGITDVNEIQSKILNIAESGLTIKISIISLIICGIVFFIWYKKQKGSTQNNLKNILSANSFGSIVLLGVSAQLAISPLLLIVSQIFKEEYAHYESIVSQTGLGNSIISLLFIIFFAPIVEELIFRGVTLKKCKNHMPFFAANLMQAILFGIYHFNIIQGMYAFLLGLVLGIVCNKYQTLLASILLHMAFNASSFLPNVVLGNTAFSQVIGGCIIFVIGTVGTCFILKRILNTSIPTTDQGLENINNSSTI